MASQPVRSAPVSLSVSNVSGYSSNRRLVVTRTEFLSPGEEADATLCPKTSRTLLTASDATEVFGHWLVEKLCQGVAGEGFATGVCVRV